MSLLMDALKKAEKAKQGPNSVFGDPPQTSPSASTGPPTDWPVLSIDPKPAELEAELGLTEPPARVAKPRFDTPSTPLALDPLPAPAAPALVEDQPKTQARAPEPDLAVHTPPATNENKSAADKEFANRQAAKRVFSAKQPGASANARTPFYAVLGILLLAGAGGAYYVWTETQSPPGLAVKGPASSATGTINGAPSAPQAAPVIPVPPPPAAPAQAAHPGPGTTSRPAAAATVLAEPVRPAAMASPAQPAQPAPPGPSATGPSSTRPAQQAVPAPREEPAPPPNPPAVAAMQAGRNGVSARGGNPVTTPANLRITRDRPGPGVDPAVSAGYAALSEGNLEAAREHYNRALEADNTNRDALLGLAAIGSRSGRRDVAENMYRRVLELQPRDPYATAQLTALHNSADTASAESRVKALLANEREPASAAPLQFALGNQMAAQGRWAEAQQAYFTAYTAESDNPDYCYNLAVSLDQLHQTRLAQDFYAKAIALSSNRRAGFDPARAKARLEQLANPSK
jgi:tetratricopeptide (TPR) repeat protein